MLCHLYIGDNIKSVVYSKETVVYSDSELNVAVNSYRHDYNLLYTTAQPIAACLALSLKLVVSKKVASDLMSLFKRKQRNAIVFPKCHLLEGFWYPAGKFPYRIQIFIVAH